MNYIFASFIVVFGLSALVSVASIPRAMTIQHPETRKGFVVFLLAIALWAGGYVGYLLYPSRSGKLAFYIFGFVFAFVAVGAFLYVSAAYTGRPPALMPYRRLVVGAFLVLVALKITNPLHHLYFTVEWASEPFPHLAIQHGLLYWLVLGLSYALIAVGFFMLIERFYRAGSDSRPLVFLLSLTAIPAGATIFGNQMFGLLPLMYEPPGVALFAVGTLFVYKRRFEAIRLTGETDKPAIFLDIDDRIRDYNAKAKQIFPGLQDSVGRFISDVDPSLGEDISETTVISKQVDEENRFYQVAMTPFSLGQASSGTLVTFTNVTDREAYRRRLEDKSDQLEALNRVVRHDIRNDMGVIVGWAEILEAEVDERGVDGLKKILAQSRHIIELTEIAADFVDSISGAESNDLKPISLSQSLETGLVPVRNANPQAVFQIDGSVPDVEVRANEMLSSVFRNLLENGVRHNDTEQPTITISGEDRGETVRMQVADNGPGIPESRREDIFGKGEKGMESPGTGIGLYLVHTLTEHYGGSVWVEDNDPRGAVFVVDLPKANATGHSSEPAS